MITAALSRPSDLDLPFAFWMLDRLGRVCKRRTFRVDDPTLMG